MSSLPQSPPHSCKTLSATNSTPSSSKKKSFSLRCRGRFVFGSLQLIQVRMSYFWSGQKSACHSASKRPLLNSLCLLLCIHSNALFALGYPCVSCIDNASDHPYPNRVAYNAELSLVHHLLVQRKGAVIRFEKETLRCPETLFISYEHANFLFSVFRVVQGEAKT